MTYILPTYLPFTPRESFSPLTSPRSWNISSMVLAPKPIKQNYGAAFKPKKAGTKTSHVIFILDASSSMSRHFDSTVSGFNEFLDTHLQDEKATGIPTFVSLYTFTGYDINQIYNRRPIKDVPELSHDNYLTSGSTNLIDAMGSVFQNTNNILKTQSKGNRDQIIITVLTDGEENSSSTFDNSDIKQMIEKAEGKNWSFIFLGANIDAFSVSKNWGFGINNTLQYSTENMGSTMRSAAGMTMRMKSAYASGQSTAEAYNTSAFTSVERNDSK